MISPSHLELHEEDVHGFLDATATGIFVLFLGTTVSHRNNLTEQIIVLADLERSFNCLVHVGIARIVGNVSTNLLVMPPESFFEMITHLQAHDSARLNKVSSPQLNKKGDKRMINVIQFFATMQTTKKILQGLPHTNMAVQLKVIPVQPSDAADIFRPSPVSKGHYVQNR